MSSNARFNLSKQHFQMTLPMRLMDGPLILQGSWIPATPGSAFNPTSLWIDGINLGRLDLDHPSVPPAMRDDITVYTPGGERKAFALSAADLMSVSGPGTAFPTMASRLAPWPLTNWALRTRSQANNAWMILLPTPQVV
ncbi:hypothetical protein AAFF39_07195 [Lactococcus garvieae]